MLHKTKASQFAYTLLVLILKATQTTARIAVKSALSVVSRSMKLFSPPSSDLRSIHRRMNPRVWVASVGMFVVVLLIIVLTFALGAGVTGLWEKWLFADDMRVFGALLVAVVLIGLFVLFVRMLMMEGRRHRDWIRTIQELEGEREARRDAEQALYSMAHDLKTPLVTLDYLLDGVIRDGSSGTPGQATGDAVRCREVVQDMDTLVKQMLDFGNGVQGAASSGHVWVASAVDEAVKMIKPACEGKGVRVDVASGPDVALRLPPEALRVVLMNLLDNAVKYGPDVAPRVRVSWRKLGRSRRGAGFVLEVADNGNGVPVHERERVFKMMARVPDPDGRDVPGSGIGLAMVRRMVLRQKGHVEVTDAPEGGALFRVVYPASCLERPRARATSRAAATAWRSSQTISISVRDGCTPKRGSRPRPSPQAHPPEPR